MRVNASNKIGAYIFRRYFFTQTTEKVRMYDQEIPQSHTADQPMAP